MLVPELPRDVIAMINQKIDNPTRTDELFAQTYTSSNRYEPQLYLNPYDIYDLGKRSSHRRVNHDLLGSALAGYNVAGPEGMRAGILHYLLDSVSDDMKQRYGARGRDLIEAYWNYHG